MFNRISSHVLFAVLALLFLACSVFTPKPAPSAADIEREEQAVYSYFVSRADLVLILQDTSTDMTDENSQRTMDYVKSGLKSISNETLDNFLKRNKQANQLSPDMDLGVNYTLISRDELHQITSQSDWGNVLAEKYPGAHGYMIFSRVGFNNSLDQAVIYVGNMAGPLMGSGYYYLMEKQNGKWGIKEQIMVWIS